MGNDKKPREMSWKKPVSKFRKMVDVGANKKFDPRFNPECGEFDAIEFQRNFEFIDELRSQDIKELKKEVKHGGVDKQRAERIKKNIIRLNNQRKATKKLRLKQELNAELRQANIERMKRGEKPKYYNNQELKNMFAKKLEESKKNLKNAKKSQRPPEQNLSTSVV